MSKKDNTEERLTTTATTFDPDDDDDDNNNKKKNEEQVQQQPLLLSNSVQHVPDSVLLEPFHYINSVPGKNVRSLLIDCFQYWFQVQNPIVLNTIKDIVGDLHNASLLIDDIEDNSHLRRGIPVAHSIFGIPPVLNCANYVYFIALDKCFRLDQEQQQQQQKNLELNSPNSQQSLLSSPHNKNNGAMSVFIQELLNLHRGQGYDILWREMSMCPSEEEYIQMVHDKTGGLFRLAVGLLQSFAPNTSPYKNYNFLPLVNDLSCYFQIRDDYINLIDEEYFKSKSFCEDITEGKFSYPIIHCIRNSMNHTTTAAAATTTTMNLSNTISSGALGSTTSSSSSHHQLLSILKQRTTDIDVKRYAQKLMKDSGSFQYTIQKCNELKKSIIQEVTNNLGGNSMLIELINKLHVQLLNNEHTD